MEYVAVVGMNHHMLREWIKDNRREGVEYILIYGTRDVRGYRFQDIVYGPYPGVTDPDAVKLVEKMITAETGEHPQDSKLRSVDENKPHKASEVICIKCRNRWWAVRPEKTRLKDLECGLCSTIGFVIETGEDYA